MVGYALHKLLLYFSAALMSFCAVAHLFFLKLLSVVCPGLTKTIITQLGKKSTMSQNPKFRYEDWGPTFFSLAFVKSVFWVNWCSLGLEAFEGYAAPDTRVYTMDGEKTSIRRFLKDGWAFANNVDISVHENLEERLAAARILVREDPLCPVVVDEMSNITASKYGALPERLYVLQGGKVFYQGAIGPWGYKPEDVRKVLEKMN